MKEGHREKLRSLRHCVKKFLSYSVKYDPKNRSPALLEVLELDMHIVNEEKYIFP